MRGSHSDLRDRFEVRGYPTMLFLSPAGESVDRLVNRDPPSVRAKFEEVVQAHARPLFQVLELSDARTRAVEQGKLVAMLFVDDDEQLAPLAETFVTEAYWEYHDQYLWVRRPTRDDRRRPTEEARGYRVNRGPKLVLLDPWAEAGTADEQLASADSFRTARNVTRELDRALETARTRQRPLGQPAQPQPPQ